MPLRIELGTKARSNRQGQRTIEEEAVVTPYRASWNRRRYHDEATSAKMSLKIESAAKTGSKHQGQVMIKKEDE